MSIITYTGNGIIQPERQILLRQVVDSHMNSQKPYLKHGFSLHDLSILTGINVPSLSSFINREYGMNFNDYVNQFRVAYFKSLIVQPEYHRWTLEAIANQAGFNSRTTFIRAFTKFASCSPSKYLKTLKYN